MACSSLLSPIIFSKNSICTPKRIRSTSSARSNLVYKIFPGSSSSILSFFVRAILYVTEFHFVVVTHKQNEYFVLYNNVHDCWHLLVHISYTFIRKWSLFQGISRATMATRHNTSLSHSLSIFSYSFMHSIFCSPSLSPSHSVVWLEKRTGEKAEETKDDNVNLANVSWLLYASNKIDMNMNAMERASWTQHTNTAARTRERDDKNAFYCCRTLKMMAKIRAIVHIFATLLFGKESTSNNKQNIYVFWCRLLTFLSVCSISFRESK